MIKIPETIRGAEIPYFLLGLSLAAVFYTTTWDIKWSFLVLVFNITFPFILELFYARYAPKK